MAASFPARAVIGARIAKAAEGTLLEVRDQDGRWVASSATSARLGSGFGSSNPLFTKR